GAAGRRSCLGAVPPGAGSERGDFDAGLTETSPFCQESNTKPGASPLALGLLKPCHEPGFGEIQMMLLSRSRCLCPGPGGSAAGARPPLRRPLRSATNLKTLRGRAVLGEECICADCDCIETPHPRHLAPGAPRRLSEQERLRGGRAAQRLLRPDARAVPG